METAKYDIRATLEHYGAHNLPHRHGWASFCCIIHDEARPSASFNEEKGSMHCFACDFSGDALDLIQLKEGCDFATAIERAKEITGEEGVELSRPAAQSGRSRPPRLSAAGTRTDDGNNRPVPARGRNRPRRIG